jgi:hypothetical protein
VITDDKVRRFLVRCALVSGSAQLKEDASGQSVRPIVADHTQEKHSRFDIAIIGRLRFEKVMH